MSGLSQAILDMIEDLKLPAQGKVPTERELADLLNASRWQIRQALDELAQEGKVWRHVGKGTFVGQRPAVQMAPLKLLADNVNPMDVIEARRALEPTAAALAAVRAKSSQIAEMQDASRRCASARNIASYEPWDEKFHMTIAAAANNTLIAALYEAVNELRKDVVWVTMKRSILRPERRALFVSQHQKIADAIARRDSDGAFNAMIDHLNTTAESYLKVIHAKNAGMSTFRT